jgi:hypothetical protein
LNDRGSGLLCAILLACAATYALPFIGQASEASIEDVIQAVHSFQQLAMLDPGAAGEIWMEGGTASDWKRFVERSVDDLFDAFVLFGHMIPFASATEDGARAGLYSPWVGMILLLSFDPLASTVESYSVHPGSRLPYDLEDPATFAASAMVAIDSAAKVFDAFKIGQSPREGLLAEDLGERLDETVGALAALYGAMEQPTEEGEFLASTVDRLFAVELEGPLALLEPEPRTWIDSLLPLWIGKQASLSFVVLASMASPLEWVWLEVDGGNAEAPVRSVSVIGLYDRMVTRGGEAS